MDTLLVEPKEITRANPYQHETFVADEISPVTTTNEIKVAKPLPPVTQFIIEELLATGKYTKASIARELDVSLITINRWANGSIRRPAHKTFSKLLTLYCLARIPAQEPEVVVVVEPTVEEAVEVVAAVDVINIIEEPAVLAIAE